MQKGLIDDRARCDYPQSHQTARDIKTELEAVVALDRDP